MQQGRSREIQLNPTGSDPIKPKNVRQLRQGSDFVKSGSQEPGVLLSLSIRALCGLHSLHCLNLMKPQITQRPQMNS